MRPLSPLILVIALFLGALAASDAHAQDQGGVRPQRLDHDFDYEERDVDFEDLPMDGYVIGKEAAERTRSVAVYRRYERINKQGQVDGIQHRVDREQRHDDDRGQQPDIRAEIPTAIRRFNDLWSRSRGLKCSIHLTHRSPPKSTTSKQ
jgi:hypothetical protein